MFEYLFRLSQPEAITAGYYTLRLLEYRQALQDTQSVFPEIPAYMEVSSRDNDIAKFILKEIEEAERIPISNLDNVTVELYANQLRGVLDAISLHSVYNDSELGQSVLEELKKGPSAWKDKPVHADLRIQLATDLPQYNLKKGAIGTVIEERSDPELAYVAEFVDEVLGTTTIADHIKPSEVINLNEIAGQLFSQAKELQSEGKTIEAQQRFWQAIRLQPGYLPELHNWILKSTERVANGHGTLEETQNLVSALRFASELDPDFEIARFNIGVVYLNYGVQRANENDLKAAFEFYHLARGMELPEEVNHRLKWNFIAAYTSLSVQAQKEGRYSEAVAYSRKAIEIESNEITRFNLGAAYTNLAGFYITQKDFDAAFEELQLARDTGIHEAQWYSNMGAVLASKRQIDGAMNLFQVALGLAPNDKFAQTNLQSLMNIKQAIETANQVEAQSLHIAFIPISPIPNTSAPVLY